MDSSDSTRLRFDLNTEISKIDMKPFKFIIRTKRSFQLYGLNFQGKLNK